MISQSFQPIKLKPGSVLKVVHEGHNHYFHITFMGLQDGVPEIKTINKGLAFILFRSSLFGWTQKNEPVKLNGALLDLLGQTLDQCST